MTTLMDAIRRATEAKRRGGPNGPDRLAPAAMLPSCEELADRLMAWDPDLSEAEALAEGAQAREVAPEVLEEHLTRPACQGSTEDVATVGAGEGA